MKMTIVVSVSDWEKSPAGDGKPRAFRTWSGPPREDGPNYAAYAWEKAGGWPFLTWGWRVWSPFADDHTAKGWAFSEAGARAAADAALAELISEAEVRFG